MTAGVALISVDWHDKPSLRKKGHKNAQPRPFQARLQKNPMILTGFTVHPIVAGCTGAAHDQMRNITAATRVGGNADPSNLSGEIAPSGKVPFRMAKPAGLGAF